MKRMLALALVLGTTSCFSHYGNESVEPKPLHYDRSQADMDGGVPSGSNLQYVGWCIWEGRALGHWVDSRSEAESQGSRHAGQSPDHPWYVLWRQAPTPTYTPVPQ